jgi:uncharacterized repeat protein (TIGR01451 family)
MWGGTEQLKSTMRKIPFKLLSLFLLLTISFFLSTSLLFPEPGKRPFRIRAGAKYIPDEIYIKFQPEHTDTEVVSLMKHQVGKDLHVIHNYNWTNQGGSWQGLPGCRNLYRVKIPKGIKIEEAISQLQDLPGVEYAEPHYLHEMCATTPNDPSYGQQWGLPKIHAPDAWDLITNTGQSVTTEIVVAVIDTGVDYTHPDLAANMWTNPGEIPGNGIDDDHNGYIDDRYGWDFAPNDNDPRPGHFHGTHCAGIIGAVGNNNVGVSGVCWHTKIMAIKIFDDAGVGNGDTVAAFQYVAMMQTKLQAHGQLLCVTSNSWGQPQLFKQSEHDAMKGCNVVHCCAASNDSVNNDITPYWPCNYDIPNIISVAATDQNDHLAVFSNYGVKTVDLGAPGVDIYATLPNNQYGNLNGTSMATPFVAGAAAMVFGADPTLTVAQCKAQILDNVDKVPALAGKVATGGRLNLYLALPAITPPPPPPPPPKPPKKAKVEKPYVVLTKTALKKEAEIGDVVPYTLTINNPTSALSGTVTIRDYLPPGFKYLPNSLSSSMPVAVSMTDYLGVTFDLDPLASYSIKYLTVIGTGVGSGDYKNEAVVYHPDPKLGRISNKAWAEVKVKGTNLEAGIIGKVFWDKNENGVQDKDEAGNPEEGVPGVKIATELGLVATTDEYGRFHLAGLSSDSLRGTNMIVKLIESTLPEGAKVNSSNPVQIRLTSGTLSKVNFAVRPPPKGPELTGFFIRQDTFAPGEKVLNITAARQYVRLDPQGKALVDFYIYANYFHFIHRYVLKLYECEEGRPGALLSETELETPVRISVPKRIPLTNLKPGKEYAYQLYVYDQIGRLDTTEPKTFKTLKKEEKEIILSEEETEGIPGFNINHLLSSNILMRGNLVKVSGSYTVTDPETREETEVKIYREFILPAGEHYIIKEGKDIFSVPQREGGVSLERIIQRIEVKETQYFLVGLTDLTLGQNQINGAVNMLHPLPGDSEYQEKFYAKNRTAFLLKGKIDDKYFLTAGLDTEENELNMMTKNLGNIEPRKTIFDALDPSHYYYPLYGDASTTSCELMGQGNLYAQLAWDNSQVIWGNFDTGLNETLFSTYHRSLYGFQTRLASLDQDERGMPDGYVQFWGSLPTSVPAHEEFLSTEGCLYYLEHKDVVHSSEKLYLRIEDQDTGLTLQRIPLLAGRDYDINHLSGIITLSYPLPSLVPTDTIISEELLNSHRVYLVCDYEYTTTNWNDKRAPLGIRGSRWMTDYLRLGGTYFGEERQVVSNAKHEGVDSTVKLMGDRITIESEYARSTSQQIGGRLSSDGGINFANQPSPGRSTGDALRLDTKINLSHGLDLGTQYQDRSRGFSSPGYDTSMGTQQYEADLGFKNDTVGQLFLKHEAINHYQYDRRGISTLQFNREITSKAHGVMEIRHTTEKNQVQASGDTVGAAEVTYIFMPQLKASLARQATLQEHNRTNNDKTTLGVNTGLIPKTDLRLEAAKSNRGTEALGSINKQVADRTEIYGVYHTFMDKLDGRKDVTTLGNRWLLNEKISMNTEESWERSNSATGKAHTLGMEHRLSTQFSYYLNYAYKNLTNEGISSLETEVYKRKAISGGFNFQTKSLTTGVKLEESKDQGINNTRRYLADQNLRLNLPYGFDFLERLEYAETKPRDQAYYLEVNTGLAYRPISYDLINFIGKYTYLKKLDPAGQIEALGYEEKANVYALDAIWDFVSFLQLTGKYAYKDGQIKLDRGDAAQWIDSEVKLWAAKINLKTFWQVYLFGEYHHLQGSLSDDERSGYLAGVERELKEHFKVSLGYNFTNFDDDLTNNNYDIRGWFINLSLGF